MPTFKVLRSARYRLQEIYDYSKQHWGEKQAKNYIQGLFDTFEQIADKSVIWRAVPAEFEVSGYFTIYQKHYIYWKVLSTGEIGIVTVLHERMHQMDRFREDHGSI